MTVVSRQLYNYLSNDSLHNEQLHTICTQLVCDGNLWMSQSLSDVYICTLEYISMWCMMVFDFGSMVWQDWHMLMSDVLSRCWIESRWMDPK